MAEVRPGGLYQVAALGRLGLQLAPGLAYRIRRAGGDPVIHGGDGVSAGPEYVPSGVRCTAVVAVVGLRAGEPLTVGEGMEVLLVVDIPPGPAIDAARAAVTWSVDADAPSC